jgi:hypothetical protein
MEASTRLRVTRLSVPTYCFDESALNTRQRFEMRSCFTLLSVALIWVASCSSPSEKPAPEPPAVPEYDAVATIKDIMDSMVDPSADYVWRSVGAEITAAGTVERAPTTDEDWAAERRHVFLLVEAANLLVMP